MSRAIEENGWGSWVDLTVVYPNLGFTGGNNLVISAALESDDPPEYVLLLNADTIVLEHALDTLVEFMDSHPRVGIAGSQLLWPDGVPQRRRSGSRESSPSSTGGCGSGSSPGWSRRGPRSRRPTVACPAEWVSGASIILRRSMLDQIGLLDEGLYTYFDDIDICLRARRAGWETWYVPESRIIHLEGSSTGVTPQAKKRRPAYWFQARRRYFLKNYGGLYTALVDAAFLFGFAIWRMRRRIQRKPDTDPPHMLGDAFRHSVFRTGFELRNVENPALREAAARAVAAPE